MTDLASRLAELSIPEPNTGCHLWLGRMCSNGRYGALNTRAKRLMAHRVSYETHRGPIPEGMFVCHKCDVTSCVNPAHLFLGTAADNMRDMAEKGRAKFVRGGSRPGEKNGRAKLSAMQVLCIRADTRRISAVAKSYGISWRQARDIKERRLWKHLEVSL